jgi:EAL domain-containing protein (putative c-di-GMP-specific phosphodiesterase class I)
VIAEGVETAEQHAFLAACGCEFFQGFLFSQALPIAAFDSYVQDSITRCANARPWVG